MPIRRVIRRNQLASPCNRPRHEKCHMLRQMSRFRSKQTAQTFSVVNRSGRTYPIISCRNDYDSKNDPHHVHPALHAHGFAHDKPKKGIYQRIEKQAFDKPEVTDLDMPVTTEHKTVKKEERNSQMRKFCRYKALKTVTVATGREKVTAKQEVKSHEE